MKNLFSLHMIHYIIDQGNSGTILKNVTLIADLYTTLDLNSKSNTPTQTKFVPLNWIIIPGIQNCRENLCKISILTWTILVSQNSFQETK